MGASPPKIKSVTDIKHLLMQPALTSHYEVYIQPPGEADKFIRGSVPNNMTDLLILSCSEASLPGSSLSTHELNNDFTGVTQRHAYRRLYDDRIDFSFYVNEKYDQIRYFEAWMRYIVGEQIQGGNATYNDYRAQYPKNYKSEGVYITKFERNIGKVAKGGKTTSGSSQKMVYTFVNAFPINISSMPVSYESSQLLKVTVSFTYDRYIAGNVSGLNSSGDPKQSVATGVPDVSDTSGYWNSTPEQQAQFNADYANAFQNINLGNLSAGTFTNTNFDPSSDPTMVFENARVNDLTNQVNFSLF
jgi:hypothetical protein